MFNFHKKGSEKTEFKFNLPKNTICFTCEHVFDEGKDILYVSHDDDGDWQFMCGETNHIPEMGKLICLEHITDMDSTLNEVADLPIGFAAEREKKGKKWIFFN